MQQSSPQISRGRPKYPYTKTIAAIPLCHLLLHKDYIFTVPISRCLSIHNPTHIRRSYKPKRSLRFPVSLHLRSKHKRDLASIQQPDLVSNTRMSGAKHQATARSERNRPIRHSGEDFLTDIRLCSRSYKVLHCSDILFGGVPFWLEIFPTRFPISPLQKMSRVDIGPRLLSGNCPSR
jgi:hypothetical protein